MTPAKEVSDHTLPQSKTKKKTAPKPKTTAKTKTTTAKTPKKQTVYTTGEKCPQSGLYTHFCTGKGEKSTIPLSKTETFPPCR
ncbi:MAG: hypothetical protein M1167_06490, partial [Chloroflexi bacterium]|nr:hypothetical protein [Chloroflexota bacterium]